MHGHHQLPRVHVRPAHRPGRQLLLHQGRPGQAGRQRLGQDHAAPRLHLQGRQDGTKLEVVARGFRAPNGMGVGPNGEITSGDNEGTWTPTCPLNWIKPGGFYGVPDFAQRKPTPTSPCDNPLCWLPHKHGQSTTPTAARSGSPAQLRPAVRASLLHTSYGTCKLYKVLKEEVGGQMQGGVVRSCSSSTAACAGLALTKSSNALFLGGLRGWQTTARRTPASIASATPASRRTCRQRCTSSRAKFN